VSSPIDGVVTRVYKDAGEFVSPNDPIIVKVVQLDPLLIVFSVPVAEARKLAAEATVKVRIESAEKPVEGVVEFVSPMGTHKAAPCGCACEFPTRTNVCRAGRLATCCSREIPKRLSKQSRRDDRYPLR